MAKVNMAPSNEELGRRQPVYPPEGRPSAQYPAEVANATIDSSEKLMEFRMLVGSQSFFPPSLHAE